MENNLFSVQDIEVTSVFFSHNRDQIRFESFPRKLVYRGRQYILADS